MDYLINSIDKWMLASDTNYLTYFVIMAVLLLIGFGVSFVYYRKIGTSDERSDLIKLRINQVTLGVGFFAAMIFISSINQTTEHISQLGLIPFAVTALAGGIASAVYYYKN